MKIRLMGTNAECAKAAAVLRDLPDLDVIDVAGPYHNRPPSRLVRFYLETHLTTDPEQGQEVGR